MFKIWMPDFDSPSYFVATAAVELGFFKEQGIDVEFVFNTFEGPELMRAGEVHFIAGPSYVSTQVFPGWKGVRLACALSQFSYWFLAVRATLDVKRGDLNALKGLRISAAPRWPEMGLRHTLADAGLDLEGDHIQIVSVPPARGEKGFMARQGVDAIVANMADAYWGNGMRAALGERLGIAKIHLDLRRGDGPPGARFYNFAALTVSERFLAEQPEAAAGAVRAIVKAQKALRASPSLATGIAERLFPADEAELIAGLIERDAPFYDATISPDRIDGIMKFAVRSGLVSAAVRYEDVVATQLSPLWTS